MAVNNAQINQTLEDKVLPKLDEYGDKIRILEPLVYNHERILYGDPANRYDEGIVGAINAMEKTFKNIGRALWIIVPAILLSLLSFAANQLFTIWLNAQIAAGL